MTMTEMMLVTCATTAPMSPTQIKSTLTAMEKEMLVLLTLMAMVRYYIS